MRAVKEKAMRFPFPYEKIKQCCLLYKVNKMLLAQRLFTSYLRTPALISLKVLKDKIELSEFSGYRRLRVWANVTLNTFSFLYSLYRQTF